ncbi:MAG: hypothetical protein M3176_19270 [Chloroflexota bacterium]|nr:hypothetical protein [Chloroflexota bacterium]
MAHMANARDGDAGMRTDQETPVWAVKQGIIGGIVAGIIFAIAEMIGGSVIDGNPFFMPLKAFASLPLGKKPPTIAWATAIPVGVISHLVLAIIYGVIFALIVAYLPMLRDSPVMIVIAASLYGFLLWLINFFVLAGAIGRPWFKMLPKGEQFVYHTFFYGTVLGLYLVAVMRRDRAVMPAVGDGAR